MLEVVGVHLPYEPILLVKEILGGSFMLPTGRSQDGVPAMEALLSQLDQLKNPAVVMGDFNMSDQQQSYTMMERRFQDAHRSRGWELGFTYAPLGNFKLAVLRIDYIFVSPEIAIMDTYLGEYSGSDHRPISPTLSWRSNE